MLIAPKLWLPLKSFVPLLFLSAGTLLSAEENGVTTPPSYNSPFREFLKSVGTNHASKRGGEGIHYVDLNSSVQLEMLWVKPGSFTMGSPITEPGRKVSPRWTPDETQHKVTLTQGFYLGKHEVTQAQYEAVMTGNKAGLSATPSFFWGNPNRPVEEVSWNDIQLFLHRLNAQQAVHMPAGWTYVLPTEAQWEYACRAGTTTAYSWGETIDGSKANHFSSELLALPRELRMGWKTHEVGKYAANPWGFFDMHGNVNEWTADRYAPYYPRAQTDPEGPISDEAKDLDDEMLALFKKFNRHLDGIKHRVVRGGDWRWDEKKMRSAMRIVYNAAYRDDSTGFRLALKVGNSNGD